MTAILCPLFLKPHSSTGIQDRSVLGSTQCISYQTADGTRVSVFSPPPLVTPLPPALPFLVPPSSLLPSLILSSLLPTPFLFLLLSLLFSMFLLLLFLLLLLVCFVFLLFRLILRHERPRQEIRVLGADRERGDWGFSSETLALEKLLCVRANFSEGRCQSRARRERAALKIFEMYPGWRGFISQLPTREVQMESLMMFISCERILMSTDRVPSSRKSAVIYS